MSSSPSPSSAQVKESIKSFIQRDPNGKYTFDSQRGSPTALLCHSASKECMEVQMMSTQLFATMQNFGFFCALPIDPEKTYMECTPLPK